ncbi:MAG: GYD family protein [Phycisphaerae bacterium SM23_30]|nr:MAG: GYD family protein [Phycisphaerae bacterium SM23_30]
MATYIILSRLSAEAVRDPSEFPKLAEQVSAKLKENCPNVEWKQSYATLGRFDVVDIVEAPTVSEVEKAAMIIRSYGHAITQTMLATPWKDFLKSLRD